MKRYWWVLGGGLSLMLGTGWGCSVDGTPQPIRTISRAVEFLVDDFEVTSLNVWEVDSKCAPGFQPIVVRSWREDIIRSSASFGSTPQDSTCSLGGDTSRNWGATGYYWVSCPSEDAANPGPNTSGFCSFVDPHGHPFYALGPVNVRPDEKNVPADKDAWARNQTAMLRQSFGANMAGAWSWNEFSSRTPLNSPQAPLARTPLLNFLGKFKTSPEEGIGSGEARLKRIAELTMCEDRVINGTGQPGHDGIADRYSNMKVYADPGDEDKGCVDLYWKKLELALVYGGDGVKLDEDGVNISGEGVTFEDHVAEVISTRFGNQNDGFNPLVTDPNVLGYFLDNEIAYSNDLLDIFYWLRGTELHYLYKIANAFLDSQIEDQGVRDRVDTDLHEQTETEPKTTQVRARFTEEILKDYFRITTQAVRSAAPNHLILGARYANHKAILPELREVEHTGIWQDRRHIFRAAGEFVDVISVNFYRDWYPPAEKMDIWYEFGGKPFMISENYIRARYKEGDPDHEMANCSGNGAGWLVNKQYQRGDYYQNFALHVLRHRGSVGLMIFRYMDLERDNSDETPKARWGHVDNKGIVDFSDVPYEHVANRMKEINSRVYGLRPNLPLIFSDLCTGAPHLEHCSN